MVTDDLTTLTDILAPLPAMKTEEGAEDRFTQNYTDNHQVYLFIYPRPWIKQFLSVIGKFFLLFFLNSLGGCN